MHPDTLVLKKERPIKGSPYAEYFADPTKLGMPGNTNPDQRLPGKELVVTLARGRRRPGRAPHRAQEGNPCLRPS